MTYGVPQGSMLGPLLFCLFINDLPLNLSNDKVSKDLFADVSPLHTRGENTQLVGTPLQGSLNEESDWSDSHSMIIHPAKAKRMVSVTRQNHHLSPLQLKLTVEKTHIEQVHKYPVLGVKIDAEMKWWSHLKTASKNLPTFSTWVLY